MGVKVGAIACVTNKAAGTVSTPPSHSEVLEAGRRAAGALGRVLKAAVKRLDREPA
jgi:purine nucleoside phosphorylase